MKFQLNTRKILFGSAMILAFFVLGVASAHAQYSYGGNYTASVYGTTITNRYAYNRTTPVYVAQPRVVTYPVPYPVASPVPYPVVYPVSYPVSYPVTTYPYYSPIQVSCTANTSNAQTGSLVTWSAYASGGNGYYTYSWSGSEGIVGYDRNITVSYSTPGQKLASVTVNSNGQSITQYCSTAVQVSGPYYVQYQTQYQQYPIVYNQTTVSNDLNIGCYSDPSTAKVNQPVTWLAEVTGGLAPYTYSWTGSDGLSGSQSSIVKYYSTSGSKSAIVMITSADGKTGTRACSNAITISETYRAPVTPTVTVTPTPSPSPTNSQTAAAFFSFGNVPWGWVAVLIIIVLFATVMYLLFNRQKI